MLAACGGFQSEPDPRPVAGEPPVAAEAPAIDEAEILVAAAARADTADRIEYQHRLIDLEPPRVETLARMASDPLATEMERQIAAWALGELGDPEGCHILDVLWLDTLDRGGESRMARAIGAARCGTFGPLRSMIEGGSIVLRLKAVITLALLNDLDSGLAIEVLSSDALADDYLPFFDLAKALLGDAVAAERIRQLQEDPLFADYVVLALARSGAEFLPAELERAAEFNPEPVLREMALEARTAVVDEGLQSLAERLLEDPAPRVRSLAALLLSLPGQLEIEAGPAE